MESGWQLHLAAIVYAGCDSKAPVDAELVSARTERPGCGGQGRRGCNNQRRLPNEPQLLPAKSNAVEAPLKPHGPGECRPKQHTSFYRADSGPAKMPKVQFTKREQSLCKVKVGDAMPAIELPKVDGGERAKLASLLGKKATVVVFWKGDRRMTNELLADLRAGCDRAVWQSRRGSSRSCRKRVGRRALRKRSTKAGAKFPNLLDADGKAFAQVGSERLPRTYVLDSAAARSCGSTSSIRTPRGANCSAEHLPNSSR